ncbi:glycosyltransferase family 39 protein [Streptomyces sp. NPDC055287]
MARVGTVERRGWPAAVLIPALFALGMGMWGLRRHGSMWRDESVTYQVSHRGPSEIWNLLDDADAVHGLYYFFMHGLFALWDGGLIALRLPSVLAVSVAAALVGLTAFHLGGPRAGLLSGLAFTVTPEVQMYAQEGRSYAMVCALVALATYLLARSLVEPSRTAWVAYAGSLLAAGWLHEFAVLALLAHGITVAISPVAAGMKRAWAFAAGFVTLGLLPLIAFSAGQSGQVSWIGSPTLLEWAEISGVALLVLLCGRYSPAAARPRVLNRLALPLAIVPTASLLLASLHRSVYVDRYVLYSDIGLALLAGMTLDRVLSARKRHVAVVAAAGAGLVLALLPVTLHLRTPDSRKDDVAAISDAVQQVARKGDAVIFAPSRRREWKLSYPGRFHGLVDLGLEEAPVASGTLQGRESAPAQIRTRMLSATRIVVLSDPPGQPEDSVAQEVTKREILRTHFQECSRTRVRGAQVTLYARPGSCGR